MPEQTAFEKLFSLLIEKYAVRLLLRSNHKVRFPDSAPPEQAYAAVLFPHFLPQSPIPRTGSLQDWSLPLHMLLQSPRMHTALPYSGTSLLTATHKHMLAESPVPKHQLPKPPCLQIQHGTHDRIYPDIFGISRNYSRGKDHIFCVPDLYRSTHLFHRKVCQNLFLLYAVVSVQNV